MPRTYYPYYYRLDKVERYLIFHTTNFEEEEDGVLVDAAGQIVTFATLPALLEFAEAHGLVPLELDPGALKRLNMDVVSRWLRVRNRRKLQPIDCHVFLTVWQFLEDVSRSVHGDFDNDHSLTDKIVDKIVCGNNFPSITPEGCFYVPFWTWSEIKIMREVLGRGLKMFRERTR
jgi:hypothetical protein